jgi:phospholipase D1/2
LKESVPRDKDLRMPWHDVHTRIIGPVVGDIARHFVERWNHDNYDNRNETTINVVSASCSIGNNSNKLKSGNINKKGFLGSIIESVNKLNEEEKSDKDSKNDDLDNGNKTITEEEISNSFDLEENYNIQSKIKVAPVFNCQNNALKELTNIKKEVKIEIKENKNEIKVNDEIKISEKSKRILFGEENNDDINKLRKEFQLRAISKISQKDEIKNHFWGKVIKKESPKLKTSKTISFPSYHSNFELKKKEWMQNLKEVDEDHLFVPKGIDSLIKSPDVINQENNNSKGAYSNFLQNIKSKSNLIFNETFKANNEIEAIITEKYIKKNSPPCTVQVLRSVGQWSLGLNTTENSILQAYYRLIEDSKHYIYIENQFFISKSFENKSYLVENKIALYIRNRILRACKNKEKFRVWVLIPLLPGFAGEPQESSTLQIILKYTYAGICRNNGLSIIEKLQQELEKVGINWENYIGFYSLRNHGVFNGLPRTEIIYIHSKLMIVDDLYVICGSANINDRSMKGSRDSEFAVLIKEKRSEISVMNNKRFKAAKFATSLRKALMAEHLGIKPNDDVLIDPLSDKLHQLIKNTAKENTFTYRQIFGCYPDDCYTKFNLIKNMNDIKNKAQEEYLKKNYEDNKNKIIGHIVEFPLHFLEEEDLGISFFSKENLVPERNFT